MKIYSVKLSEDGTARQVYTNIKALYNGIETYGYTPKSVHVVNNADMPYTYENLLKAIKASSSNGKYYAIAFINCDNGSDITIVEHEIVSK
jgi:hypothetical protein